MKLAEQAPFALGSMRIDPPLREAAWPGGRQTLQPKAMQVLVALAGAQGGVVSRDRLAEACWGERTAGDDAIQRIIHLLRDLARASGGAGFAIETVSKVGYRLIATDAPSAPPAPPEPARPRPAPAAADEGLRLAVLAFDCPAGEAELARCADGVSEAIFQAVLRASSLSVVGRSSSVALRGADKTADRAAQLLGATHVIDGTVRRAGERVRARAELVECAGRTTLWSGQFERPPAESAALQEDVAIAAATALNVACAPSVRLRRIDPAAIDLYLKARLAESELGVPHTGLLEQALGLAPDFAHALALLAYARGLWLRWAVRGEGFAKGRAEIIGAARRALELDPGVATAYLALALVEPICGREAEHCALVDQALAAAPNDPLVLLHACARWDVTGCQRRGFTYAARAYELDPRVAGFYYADLLAATGRGELARALFDRDLARWPGVLFLNTNALRFAYEAGDWDWYDRLIAALPGWVAGNLLVAMIRNLAGQLRAWSPQTAQAALGRMREELDRTGTVGLTWAAILCERGHGEAVFELLEAASFAHLFTPEGCLAAGDMGLNLLFTPHAAALRRDRRFVALCAKLGLVDHWLRSGEWPDFAREVAGDYDLQAEARALAQAEVGGQDDAA